MAPALCYARLVSVSTHLAINIDEYDARIRTFIPRYEEMLDAAARVAGAVRPLKAILDLGTGTGALASRVMRLAPHAAVTGIDEDAAMLTAAARRLRRYRLSLVHDSFLTASLPRCDVITASFALHHIKSSRAKRALYVRARAALHEGGRFVSADCHPSSLAARAAEGRRHWRDHIAGTYGPRQAEAFLRAWANEDFYMPLEVELRLLQSAGFAVDVVWRCESFAVLVGEARRTPERVKVGGGSSAGL
jgi:tRNA (cmo5U34)-methyltransferase